MPEVGNLVNASLTAADSVLIPVQPQILDVEGLPKVVRTIHQVQRRINPRLVIDGVLFTMADYRTNLTRDMIAAVHKSYGAHTRIYKTVIPRCVRVAESANEAQSALNYDAKCTASVAYRALAKEVDKGERVRRYDSGNCPTAQVGRV